MPAEETHAGVPVRFSSLLDAASRSPPRGDDGAGVSPLGTDGFKSMFPTAASLDAAGCGGVSFISAFDDGAPETDSPGPTRVWNGLVCLLANREDVGVLYMPVAGAACGAEGREPDDPKGVKAAQYPRC